MLNLSAIRLATTAWPASGDSVALSDSYFGHVTMRPVIPACVPSPVQALAVVQVQGEATVQELAPCVPLVRIPLVMAFATMLFVTCAAIGQASRPVEGSMVPAREFDNGWLNMSWVSCPVTSPSPP